LLLLLLLLLPVLLVGERNGLLPVLLAWVEELAGLAVLASVFE
jgi:hypothetical protein